MKSRTVTVIMKEGPGAIPRVVQIFARRGFAVDELHATTKEDTKEITITFPADDYVHRIVVGQLNKLTDSIEVKE